MKFRSLGYALAGMAFILCAADSCTPTPTANDLQRDQQNRITTEAASEVGMPNITHFREMRLLKTIYEMRDQADLATWSYRENVMTGKLVFLCESIGYPIPYATQYSAPESMQYYNVTPSGGGSTDSWRYGVARLPQSEPNGLNMPAAAAGTWVMCIGPDKKPHPVYSEPNILALPYEAPANQVQQ